MNQCSLQLWPQRPSLRDPLQIALLKAIGASAPMLLLALAAGQPLPSWPVLLALLAIGAVILADTRRLGDCFAAVDYFEARNMPFVIGINPFDGRRTHTIEAIREAVQVEDRVPMLYCDARERGDVKNGLIALVELALMRERSKTRV